MKVLQNRQYVTLCQTLLSNTKKGILQQARDWTLQADLDKKLQFQDIRCIRNEESQVHRPTHSVQRVWMANLSVPSRSGLSGVSSVDHIELLRHSRKQHRAAVKALGTSCRMSIQVDTAKRDQDNWKLSNDQPP